MSDCVISQTEQPLRVHTHRGGCDVLAPQWALMFQSAASGSAQSLTQTRPAATRRPRLTVICYSHCFFLLTANETPGSNTGT